MDEGVDEQHSLPPGTEAPSMIVSDKPSLVVPPTIRDSGEGYHSEGILSGGMGGKGYTEPERLVCDTYKTRKLSPLKDDVVKLNKHLLKAQRIFDQNEKTVSSLKEELMLKEKEIVTLQSQLIKDYPDVYSGSSSSSGDKHRDHAEVPLKEEVTKLEKKLCEAQKINDQYEKTVASLTEDLSLKEQEIKTLRSQTKDHAVNHRHSEYHSQVKKTENRPSLVRVQPTKGEQIGVGAYGYVCMMGSRKKQYAGKFFHEHFIQSNDFHAKFLKESMVLSHLCHENVVQYCGVCHPPDHKYYCLLMELMCCSLEGFLCKSKQCLFVKVSILWDVAKGLSYLHAGQYPVIHRDLTARNVLLSAEFPPLVAKISDLGNARVIDIEAISERKHLTKDPGTLLYMPPEADGGKYDEKLDIFSFGHLALYTITQDPIRKEDLLPTKFLSGGQYMAHTEVKRREKHLFKLDQNVTEGSSDLIRLLIVTSLAEIPQNRPSASELVSQLERIIRDLVSRSNESQTSSTDDEDDEESVDIC